MLIDKEYPATHSMKTAWYIVDEDGNVGIMECEDNGPVPINCYDEVEYAVDLFQGAKINGKNYQINLTPKQKAILDANDDFYFFKEEGADYSHLPFFMYGNDFNCTERQTRYGIPDDPIKESQLPQQILNRATRIPLKFTEYEKIQFGEFVPFYSYGYSGLQCDRFNYVEMELTDGSMAYIRDDQGLKSPKPTAFAICRENDQNTGGFKPYGQHSEMILYASYMYTYKDENVEEQIEYFSKFQPLMEKVLKMLNPYLIVIDVGAMEVVKHFYKLSKDKIEICGMELPYCTNKTIDKFDDVYLKPYQGEKLPKILRIP